MSDIVKINEYGFHELVEKPSDVDLEKYYSNVYYQESKGSYEKDYSISEVEFIKNKLIQKYSIMEEIIDLDRLSSYNFLDIGCGEGWALSMFKDKGWNVVGLDYSSFGINKFNNQVLGNLIDGDIYVNVEQLIKSKKKFECIYLINVLEHVLEPLTLLKQCYKLLSSNGVIVIQVPNDFSITQEYLINNKMIDRQFWVSDPDHISYFNMEGLINITKEVGFSYKNIISDFPIDLNLFNINTNYVMDKSKGKAIHNSRVEIENFFHNISISKVNKLYGILAEMGLGRTICMFFTKD